MPRRLALVALFAIPLTASAQSASVDACSPVSPPATTADGGIRVPFTLINNHVYVQVCAAGRTLSFILDTGAGTSTIDLHLARELGLAERGDARARGGGAGTVAGARIDSLPVSLGGTSQVVRLAIDLTGVSLGEGYVVQGILGYDFISRWVLSLDYARAELTMYDPGRFRYAGSGAVIPIVDFDRNHPLVRAEIVVNGETIGIKSVVDIGASTALALTKPFVERHELRRRVTPTVRTVAAGGIGGPMLADVGRIDALRLGPYTLERPITQLFGDSAGVFTENRWDANIGGEVTRRFTVWLDYGRKQMILEPLPSMTEPFEGDMSGLRVRAQQRLDSLVVAYVTPGFPAAEAGFRSGDVITAVDGESVTSSTLRTLRARLRRPDEHLTIEVRRGGERLELRLTTRRVL